VGWDGEGEESDSNVGEVYAGKLCFMMTQWSQHERWEKSIWRRHKGAGM
jgi:hypothetical protein